MDAQILDQTDFPSVTMEDWAKLVGKVLKGADFDQALVTRTSDNIKIQPLSMRHKLARPLGRQNPTAPWTRVQRLDDPVSSRASAQVETDTANGATGISIVFQASVSGFGTGISYLDHEVIETLKSKNVDIRIEAASADQSISSVTQFLSSSPSRLIHTGLDLFTQTINADTGSDSHQREVIKSEASRLFSDSRIRTVLNADGRFAHNCGATEAQELALIAASLIESLRILEPISLEPEAILAKTSLCVSVNQNQYLNIAKLRALRLISAKIQAVLGIPVTPMHVHAETSWRMLTQLDPETNILRNTIAAFSAGIAGADEITVLPHTLAIGLPDPLARRLARNVQLILAEECHLGHVNDASAGSGGLESLTDNLAQEAWHLFQEIEKQGGLSAAMKQGTIRSWIETARQNSPASPIVGTTIYPQKSERPINVLQPLEPWSFGTGLQPQRLDQTLATKQGDGQ